MSPRSLAGGLAARWPVGLSLEAELDHADGWAGLAVALADRAREARLDPVALQEMEDADAIAMERQLEREDP